MFINIINMSYLTCDPGFTGEFSSVLYEDIQDATHTPKWEGRHHSLIFGTVLGGNVHQWHICNKCVADGLYA